MDLGLKGKVVVITGGSSGLGKGCAWEFAKEGCRVVICGTKPEKLEKARKELADAGYDVFAMTANVAEKSQVQALADATVARYGAMDIWLSNAATFNQCNILELSEETWHRVLAVNLDATLWSIQVAGKYMKEHGGGVIMVSSSFSGQVASSLRAAYAASKGGINSLVRVAAGALAPFNIRVNAVACGSINTEIQANRTPEEIKHGARLAVLQRIGAIDEATKPYVFLASDAANYITGEVLDVSGGKMIVQDPEVPWVTAGIEPKYITPKYTA